MIEIELTIWQVFHLSLLASTYFVEKHLVIREPSDEVSQAMEEDQGLQGDLTETSDETQPQLEKMKIISGLIKTFSYLSNC